jgi:hypothetical protein
MVVPCALNIWFSVISLIGTIHNGGLQSLVFMQDMHSCMAVLS